MKSRMSVCVWIVFVSAGCGVEHYRAETVLKSDGRVDRSIWQSSLSDEHRKLWPEVQTGVHDKQLDWEWIDAMPRGGEAEAKANGKASNHKDKYVFAHGEFASLEQVPEHYRKSMEGDEPSATLRRKSEREDLIFLTEHRWTETLTDVVKLEDIPAARRELIELLVPVIVETLRQELDTDYDISAVETFMRDEGAKWLEELVSLYVDLSVRNSSRWTEDKELKHEAEMRLAAVNRQHGLKSMDSGDIHQFGISKIRAVIKRRDGRPLDDRIAKEILRWLMNESEQEGDPENRFKQSFERVIKSRFDSKEAFEKQTHLCLVRIFGMHHPLQTPQHFNYRLTMPGIVVETNGLLLDKHRVRWRFSAAQAFPFGFAMRCRSLEPNEANQRAVFGEVLLMSSDRCEKLVRLLRAQPDWRETLQQCVAQKSKQPLLDLRRQVLNRKDVDERFKLEALESLLLPEQKK